MRDIGLEPGPKYQEVKLQETFEYKGLIYNSDDFKGKAKPGPIISIFGDTKPCENEYKLANNSDLMIHEATYIEGDKKLANNYHHSHIDDVFNLIKQANVNKSLITHISNRYNIDEVTSIYNELSLDQTSPNFYFVKDFDTFKYKNAFSQNTILGEKRFIYSSSLCDNSILLFTAAPKQSSNIDTISY